jgi:hypothetical protein
MLVAMNSEGTDPVLIANDDAFGAAMLPIQLKRVLGIVVSTHREDALPRDWAQ